MDKASEQTLKTIYNSFETRSEINVSSPEYDKTQIDMLLAEGLIEKLDASSLSGWEYILRPTYAGRTYFEQKKAAKTATRRHNAIEVLKFAIPTIISIIALIVSILK